MKRWDVHKILVPDIEVDYPKFVIVAQVYSNSFIGVLINTDMPAVHKASPEQHKCHPIILQSQHPFLSYDSHIGCANSFEIEAKLLTAANHQGCLSSQAIADLLKAVGSCNIMLRRHKRDILEL